MTQAEELEICDYLYHEWLKEERENEIEYYDNRYEKRLDDYFDFD